MSPKLKVAVAALCGTALMAGGVAYAAPNGELRVTVKKVVPA